MQAAKILSSLCLVLQLPPRFKPLPLMGALKMLLSGWESLWGSDLSSRRDSASSGAGESPSVVRASSVVAKIPEEMHWKGPAVLEATHRS